MLQEFPLEILRFEIRIREQSIPTRACLKLDYGIPELSVSDHQRLDDCRGTYRKLQSSTLRSAEQFTAVLGVDEIPPDIGVEQNSHDKLGLKESFDMAKECVPR
jgi:hypothetical protein